MTIHATVTTPFEPSLETLFRSEEETFRHPRATYRIARRGPSLMFTIQARDATALKATVASICRVIAVHEKARLQDG